MNKREVIYTQIKQPQLDCALETIELTNETINNRKNKIINKMKEKQLDSIIVYGDLEHGSNFEYLVGFLPRFEEAILVLHQTGEAYLLLGNENLNKAKYSRIPVHALHTPFFSLPNQPMDNEKNLEQLFKEAKIKKDSYVGIVGWKLFTSQLQNNQTLFDVPYYIVESLKKVTDHLVNATDIYIGSNGARATNNANEIAHYECFSSLASDCMLKAMNALEVGKTEMEIGNILNAQGQRNSIVTIAASRDRFKNAYLYPRNQEINLGDPMSLTVGYRGGASSRSGIVVYDETELPEENQDYLEAVVKPYYYAIVTWLENIDKCQTGDKLYQLIEKVLPKEKYHWSLNPGHLTSEEEWLCSPVYQGSKELIKSGMIFQTDIIPSIPGYPGTSVESTVLLADETLQKELAEKYPQLWKRFQARREYIINEYNIHLGKNVLPMTSTLVYLRPFLLNKQKAMKMNK